MNCSLDKVYVARMIEGSESSCLSDTLPDKFDDLLANLEGMPEPQRKATLRDLEARCTCPSCKTYTECAKAKAERLYCLEGKSPDCITKGVECICPSCPVQVEYTMRDMYYCIEGSEDQKRMRRAERAKAKAQGQAQMQH